MKLYHIQDPDRPMYVVAANWQDALSRWKSHIREENDGEEGDEPSGITIIAEEDDLII